MDWLLKMIADMLGPDPASERRPDRKTERRRLAQERKRARHARIFESDFQAMDSEVNAGESGGDGGDGGWDFSGWFD